MKNFIGLALMIVSCMASGQAEISSSDSFPGVVNLEVEDGKSWGLEKSEWNKYKELMKGEAGLFYAKASPQYVLAVYEKDPVKRREYAKEAMLIEKKRHSQALDMFALQTKIAVEEMGSESRLVGEKRKEISQPTKEKLWQKLARQRSAIFITTNCKKCDENAKKEIKSHKVDFYIVGAKSDKEIREWAAKIGIPVDKIKSRAITINHGTELAKKLGIKGYPETFIFDGENYEKVSK